MTERGFDVRGSMGGSSQGAVETPTVKQRNRSPRLPANFIALLALDTWIFWGSYISSERSALNPLMNLCFSRTLTMRKKLVTVIAA